MTNLTDNAPRPVRNVPEPIFAAYPVTGGTPSSPKIVYQGAAVEKQSDGGMDNATGAGTTFAGIAMEKGVQTLGIGSGPNIKTLIDGVVLLPVVVAANVARTNIGATVYVTDGNLFTVLSTSAQSIGKIVEVPEDQVGLGTGYLWVRVAGVQARHL